MSEAKDLGPERTTTFSSSSATPYRLGATFGDFSSVRISNL